MSGYLDSLTLSAGVDDGWCHTVPTFADWECGVLTVRIAHTAAALTFYLASILRVAELALGTRIALSITGVLAFTI